jgi:uncharacterized Ntn-hydrolase superfamily protein
MHPSTFSIVAHDPSDTAWGIAVASKFPAVGAVVPWAEAETGAVATQSYANTTFGTEGLKLLRQGQSAQDVLARLLASDPEREKRQVGVVDARGQAATFTGSECFAWAGGLTGPGFAAQGNLLVGPDVVEAMASTFVATSGDLPDRLLAALLAGERAGGDRRGRQSSALFVVKTQAGYGGFNDRWIDYRVDDHPNPVPRLVELLALHRLYFGSSPESERLSISGEVCQRLQGMMRRLGFYEGPASGEYDGPTRKGLEAFLGNENFEDRTDFENGRIDAPVFAHLSRTFPD